jgi:hypothetical protein
LIVNGRAVDLGGSRSAGPARLADPSSGIGNQGGFRSGRLPQSTLPPANSATAVANNVLVNNTSNSGISVWQINTGRVSASVTQNGKKARTNCKLLLAATCIVLGASVATSAFAQTRTVFNTNQKNVAKTIASINASVVNA